MKEKIKAAVMRYLDSEFKILDAGITEILWQTYSDTELSLGVSYETNDDGEKVYIFNIFIDGEYINISGDFRRDEVNDSLFAYLTDCWYNTVALLNHLSCSGRVGIA